jgi:RNA-directed DNA polymerase
MDALQPETDTIPHDRLLALVKSRVAAGRSLKAIITDVNRTLRGWYGYFQHSKANVFATMDGYVRGRLRSLLEKPRDHTRQGLGQAHHRWPNKWFAKHGYVLGRTP